MNLFLKLHYQNIKMEEFLIQNKFLIFLLILWQIPWKSLALWKAAKNNHKTWFLAILLINSLAILEILYIFVFGKKRSNSPPS